MEKYQDILGPSLTLSKLLDTPDIKELGRYMLELKQYRENKLQNVNHNHANIHQHVTNETFQEQGGDNECGHTYTTRPLPC